MTKPQAKAAPQSPAKSSLPNDEVQALADRALKAWESGVPGSTVDTGLALWVFAPLRDGVSRLEVTRTPVEGSSSLAVMSQAELGTETARVTLTSRLLALVNPA